MFKKITCHVVWIYGIVLSVLGFVGYQNSGSKPSLIMGMGFGVLMLLSARLLFAKNKTGVFTSLLATIMLTITFAIRYNATGKMIPGVMCLISAAVLAFLVTQMWTDKKR